MTIKQGYIYVLRSSDAIKVGFTQNLDKRIKKLERWDYELEPILYTPASIAVEKQIHKILKAQGFCIGNEWYDIKYKDCIIDIIVKLLKNCSLI